MAKGGVIFAGTMCSVEFQSASPARSISTYTCACVEEKSDNSQICSVN